MTFETAQQAIIDKLKALATEYVFDSFEVSLPAGYATQYQDKAPLPYVLYDFGGKGATDVYSQGITGTRDNLKWSMVIFEVVAPDPASVRKIMSILRDNFTGYSPDPTWGEMVERYNAYYTIQQPEGTEFWPERFVRDLVYIIDVDA